MHRKYSLYSFMEQKQKQLQALRLHHWKERALRFSLMPITQFFVFAWKCTFSQSGSHTKFKVWMTIVECGWNVWVCLVGEVSRRQVWLLGVGGIYGCG